MLALVTIKLRFQSFFSKPLVDHAVFFVLKEDQLAVYERKPLMGFICPPVVR
jgi:hypothetical protein